MKSDAEARNKRRLGWVMAAGYLLNFAMPLAFASAAMMLDRGSVPRWMAASIGFLLLAMPSLTGAVVAFLGMTLTNLRGVEEWGRRRPSKCFFWGLFPYFLFSLVELGALFMITICSLVAWALTCAGGYFTAMILHRMLKHSDNTGEP